MFSQEKRTREGRRLNVNVWGRIDEGRVCVEEKGGEELARETVRTVRKVEGKMKEGGGKERIIYGRRGLEKIRERGIG